MQKPLTIAFRHIDSSEAIEEIIRKRVEKLERIYNHIVHCAVSVEAQKNHAQHGYPFAIRVELVVPGKNIVVKSNSEMHHANVDAYAAIRLTFDALERRLIDYARIQRHHIERHAHHGGMQFNQTGRED